MPTWPTTTISTTHLDQGSDRPSLARADIKSMADVVNELVNYGAPQSGLGAVSLSISTIDQNISGDTYRKLITSKDHDNLSICTLSDSDYRFSLPSGTYYCSTPLIMQDSEEFYVATFLYNYTSSSNLKEFVFSDIGTTGLYNMPATPFFTLASTTTFEIRTESLGLSGRRAMPNIHFVKLA